MRNIIIAIIFLSCYGCAWVDSPIKLTEDEYMVVCGGNYRSWSEIKKDCYKEAEIFCGEKNIKLVSYTTHGVRGWSPQESELTFRCK